MTIKLKQKFCVVKTADLLTALNITEQNILDQLLMKIELYRKAIGKTSDNNYVVINTDEPYIDEIKAIMEKHGHWEEEPCK